MWQAIRLYERMAQPVYLAWVFILLLLLLIIYSCRALVIGLLLKLYEVFIQQDWIRFSGSQPR